MHIVDIRLTGPAASVDAVVRALVATGLVKIDSKPYNNRGNTEIRVYGLAADQPNAPELLEARP